MNTNANAREILNRFACHRRKRFLRLAILLIAVWQVGTALVPHTGSFSGATSRRPHLHATGDQLELAHDEAACPACSGHHAAIGSSSPVRPWAEFVHRFHAVPAADHQAANSSSVTFIFTRGPPSLS